ncbi:MAG: sodium:proton antiporter [Flavobacteriales bacterium]|nr:sodium:proton antiporter [Flavobacteriales bacterium]
MDRLIKLFIKPLTTLVIVLSLTLSGLEISAAPIGNQVQDIIENTTSSFKSIQHDNHEHADSHEEHSHNQESVHEEHGEVHEEEHGGGHHGPDTSLLFFVIIAVLIGALTRHFLKGIPVPFTALLLIIGILLGVVTRMGGFDHWGSIDVSIISKALHAAANIDPHMLLYVFLPILIFEAAFAMDLHTFKKSAANSVILAVPGIVVALVLTAIMVYGIDYLGLGLPGWANWSLALMFGSVISATDPVAVVALLKDLGASKKLGTLIEGESLLNDGTAIVIFMVFLAAITGDTSGPNGFVQFGIVSFGGIGVGLVIGWLMLKWIKKVFNDAMVEITAVVAAAYITFYIAEYFLHVSGVLALVALGLVIGGMGRSTISPQVEHFMHEFWELAGFIANCLIFLIVGLVIAERTEFNTNDFMMLGIVYVGIHIVRAIVMLTHYPYMKNTGYGLPVKDAIVVWFGALRGAIGFALALIVMNIDTEKMATTMEVTPELAETIKNQFLFLIAGTVTLTLLVNATTIKFLVNYLGLLDVAPAKQQMIYSANKHLKESVENQMNAIQSDRYLKKANWDKVSAFTPHLEEISDDVKNAKLETISEARRRILEKEKSSYWRQFKDGLLGAEAVEGLSNGINDLLDAGGGRALSDRDDLEESWEAPKWMQSAAKTPGLKGWGETLLLNRLSKSYDSAVGFITAQNDCGTLLESIARGKEVPENEISIIEEEINENRIHGQAFVRNLRKNYPDIYVAISTQQAIRNLLNYEKSSIDRLKKKGRIDDGEAEKMHNDLKERSKRLIESPPEIEHTEPKKKKKKPPIEE